MASVNAPLFGYDLIHTGVFARPLEWRTLLLLREPMPKSGRAIPWRFLTQPTAFAVLLPRPLALNPSSHLHF